MRHSVFGRKLSRTKNERRRLFQGLVKELIKRGKITTTLAKAKAVQPLVENLITRAKYAKPDGFRALYQVLGDKTIANVLLAQSQTRFSSRISGYTRIVRLGQRLGDATERVLLQLVDEAVVVDVSKPEIAPKAQKKSETPKKPETHAKKRGRPKKTT